MNAVGTRTIETKRCILRRICTADAPMMYENWARFQECSRYFPFDPPAGPDIYGSMVDRWVSSYSSGTYFHWVIEWKENGELIGTVNLGNVDEASNASETCYILSPKYWGRGIMTEVFRAVLRYAFEEIGLNRVQAEVFAGNSASEHILTKCGMQFEGIAREKYYKHGTYIDAAQYAIIRSDYELI